MQKITPFLWFDTQAEEAAKFYASVFPNSKILKTARYGEAGPGPEGSVMTAELFPVPDATWLAFARSKESCVW